MVPQELAANGWQLAIKFEGISTNLMIEGSHFLFCNLLTANWQLGRISAQQLSTNLLITSTYFHEANFINCRIHCRHYVYTGTKHPQGKGF
jgi:hypothetical protein